MRRTIAMLGWLTLGLAMVIAGDVAAAGAKKKDAGAWAPPTHIHMKPMMVRAGHTTVPMTFFLEVTKPQRSEDVCKRMPRIRDAVIRTLSKNPIPVRNSRLVLKDLDTRIAPPMNRAVGKRYIRRVFVAKGAVRMGTGKIKHRPYAVIDGCVNVLRSEKEREQAARAAK